MSTFSYKGYIGSIEISEEDNCLYGRVLDLPNDTAITYEGSTVAELKADFEGAVDDYIQLCEENGVKPQRCYSGTLNVRISPETHCKLATLAKKTGVSLNAFIREALDKAAML